MMAQNSLLELCPWATLKKLGLCPSLPIIPGQSGLLEGEHARSELCSYLNFLSILPGSSISGIFFMLHKMHICYQLITSLRIK